MAQTLGDRTRRAILDRLIHNLNRLKGDSCEVDRGREPGLMYDLHEPRIVRRHEPVFIWLRLHLSWRRHHNLSVEVDNIGDCYPVRPTDSFDRREYRLCGRLHSSRVGRGRHWGRSELPPVLRNISWCTSTVSPSGDVAVHPTSAWVAGSGFFSTREDAHP